MCPAEGSPSVSKRAARFSRLCGRGYSVKERFGKYRYAEFDSDSDSDPDSDFDKI